MRKKLVLAPIIGVALSLVIGGSAVFAYYIDLPDDASNDCVSIPAAENDVNQSVNSDYGIEKAADAGKTPITAFNPCLPGG